MGPRARCRGARAGARVPGPQPAGALPADGRDQRRAHRRARRRDTDWSPDRDALRAALRRLADARWSPSTGRSPSPSSTDPRSALAVLEPLALTTYTPWHASRADLLRRLDRRDEAREAYDDAIATSDNEAERAWLRTGETRCNACRVGASSRRQREVESALSRPLFASRAESWSTKRRLDVPARPRRRLAASRRSPRRGSPTRRSRETLLSRTTVARTITIYRECSRDIVRRTRWDSRTSGGSSPSSSTSSGGSTVAAGRAPARAARQLGWRVERPAGAGGPPPWVAGLFGLAQGDQGRGPRVAAATSARRSSTCCGASR